MYTLPLLFSLPLLSSAFPSAPSPRSDDPPSLTPPPSTYPNGTSQPFFPCGYTASQVTACPYRCLTSTSTLDPSCFTASTAAAAIAAGQNCVKCVEPTAPADLDASCQPFDPVAYFTSTTNYRPSPCGVATDSGVELDNCAWICGEAQVPFSLCSATDTSGPFSLCGRCRPQCSSPRVVFDPPDEVPANFSLAAGSCSEEYGAPEGRWCPFRCSTAGDPNAFCSERDQSDSASGGFTSCARCD